MITTVCVDVGSVSQNNFGWWSDRDATASGTLPSEVSKHVAVLLNKGLPVALGFECPLFVPIAEDETRLTNSRPGEGSRPWSAGAGSGSLATGLTQVTWVLREIRRHLEKTVSVSLDWRTFGTNGSALFLWEAFVTGPAKTGDHVQDARAGAQAFAAALPNLASANCIVCDGEVQSLVAASLLRTGWTQDVALLQQPCLVIRAAEHVV